MKVTKDFGIHVLNHWNVSEYWMPAVCGAVFSPVFIICCKLMGYRLPFATYLHAFFFKSLYFLLQKYFY